MKKLMALLMALAMAVCTFSACSKDEKKEDKKGADTAVTETADDKKDVGSDKKVEKADSDEDAVKDVVDGYLETLFSADDAALDYTKEGSEAYDSTKELVDELGSITELAGGLEDLGLDEKSQKDVEKSIEKFMDDVFALVKYDIEKVEIDGDNATAEVTLKSPDFEGMDDILTDDKMQEVMLKEFSMEEIEALASATPEEQGKMMVKLFDAMFEYAVDELAKTSSETEGKINLEKVDGEWLIVSEDEVI